MRYIESVIDNIRENYEELFAAEKKIADFILEHGSEVVALNVSELAEQSGASDATVIRFCKHLGYKGFYNMKLLLAHDFGRDQLLGGDGSEEILTIDDLFRRQAQNILSISASLDKEAIDRCAELLAQCSTVLLVAAGNTIPTASDLEFRLGHAGIRTSSPLMPEHQLTAINLATPQDVVLGISHSGSSNSVLQAFELAKERGLQCIALTDTRRSPLDEIADITISTGIENSGLSLFGAESHIYLMAALDAILFRISKLKDEDAATNRIEMLLSQTKL